MVRKVTRAECLKVTDPWVLITSNATMVMLIYCFRSQYASKTKALFVVLLFPLLPLEFHRCLGVVALVKVGYSF